jgi:antitoxin component YwqK of YwqJK toxin-antitoxin module
MYKNNMMDGEFITYYEDSIVKSKKLYKNGITTLFIPCDIRIKGTYNGKKIDVTVTVEADNCAKAAGALLKEFTKEETKTN